MADNDFAETKKVKQIKIKAVACFILALVMFFGTFSTVGNVEAAENTDSVASVEIIKDGKNLYLYLRNCKGLTTLDFSVKLNPSVVDSVTRVTGKDFSKMQKKTAALTDYVMIAVNTNKLSDIRYSLIFADKMCSSEEFGRIAEGCGINGEYFHFATLKLKLKKGYSADDIKISAKGTATFGVNQQKSIKIVAGDKDKVHSHEYTETLSNKADCTKAGVKTCTCICGYSYTEENPARAKHKLSWKVVKKATSFQEGKKEGRCKYCNYKKTATIEKLSEIGVKPEKKSEIKLSGENFVLCVNGITVADMLSSLPANVVIQTADEKDADKKALVATEMKIVMTDSQGKVIDSRVIVVVGDVDCDGTVSASDSRIALRKSVGLDSLNSSQTVAADIQQDSAVNADDARTILRAAVGLENVRELFKKIA